VTGDGGFHVSFAGVTVTRLATVTNSVIMCDQGLVPAACGPEVVEVEGITQQC
jgi:hypothetical protein